MSDLRQNRPRFSGEEARSLVQEFYGLDGTLAELPSERDQNFHLRVLKTEREFVLKISSAAEQQEVLEFQNKAIEHLARNVPEFIWPRIQVSKAGESIVRVAHSSGSRHYVRLLTHLPGRFLAEVRPHRPGLLRSLGCFLGRMDMALFSFQHPAMERELKWDMRKALTTLNRLLPFIEGEEERNLARHFMGLYEQRVVPLLPGLRTSVIHNDANDYNVLVGHASADPAGRFGRVAGIIDFGDMLCGYTVGELAVGVTYAAMGKNDPLEAAALIVSAYHEVLPLEASEAEVLYDLIAIRLLLSVAISAEQKKQEEANAYLTISEKPAWTLLREWRRISPSWARRVFRNACGLSVCPESVHIKGWLKDHQKDLGPVLQSSFEETPPLVLDLSVTSPGLNERAGGWDTRELSAWISSQLRAASRRVGLGRYNEIRGFYTSDMFKLRRNDGFEQRTLHLGVDLFLDPGSAVLAPLDGTVHSFRDNDNPLDYGPTIILEHRTGEGQLFYTLYGHLSRDSLKGLAKGMLIKKGDRLGRIGSYAENGGWPPHLHFQVMADMLDRKGDFPGVAPPSQKEIWIALCPDPNLVLKIPEDTQPGLSPERTRKEILLLRRKHLGPTLSIAYKRPLKIVRGFGQFLYDENGQAYLDAVNNVAHVGHCHPRVVKAARGQMAVLNTNTRYLHDYLVEYALRLAEKLPESLHVFYFVSSGSEANDLALRLAWTHTGRQDIVVVDGSYHGNLSSLIDISPYKFDGPGGRGAPPHVHKVPTPDGYRGPHKSADPHAGHLYALAVKQAVERIEEQGRGIAAFICESLMGCAGQIVYPEGYLAEVFSSTRRAGGLCIADEVQVGFGRVGSHFWGFETQGVCPDIVTMGKPIGNGHPLAAVVTTPEIAASFNTGMEYFNTFGGNPVSCAVGLAVLEVIREEKLQQRAFEVGAYLKSRLAGLKKTSPLVGDVRGMGLFLGIELVLDPVALTPATAEAAYVAERMRDKGVLVSTDGPFRNVLKIKPPLVFTAADADFLIGNLAEILAEDALKETAEG